MVRFLVVIAATIFAAPFSSAAEASTVQYDLTFTPTTGSIGGTGYFDVSSPVNGVDTLTAFSLSIDGQVFTLGNELGAATATFSNGALSSLNYVGALTSGFNLDILGTGGLSYAFLDVGSNSALSVGTISAAAAPAATPLPNPIVLFASVLLGILALSYWRRNRPIYNVA
jgi:hypothetical protein